MDDGVCGVKGECIYVVCMSIGQARVGVGWGGVVSFHM